MNEGLILNILNSFKVLVYCQAQPQLQLSWAELALLSISPSRLAGQNSTFASPGLIAEFKLQLQFQPQLLLQYKL